MDSYNELIESLRSMEPMVCSTAADAIEALQSRIGGLCAARIAYASEFPPDAEGLPDTGSIHANIRAMKARVAELESRLEISPLHNVDGIMARDATIKLQDERIAELEAERDVWRNKYMDKIGQMDVLQEFASKLEAERAEREKQEPIATVGWDRNFMGVVWHGKDMPEKGVETLLYAAPPVTAPVRLTDTDFNRLYDEAGFDPNEMREAAEHMFNAIQSAVLRANGFKVEE